MSEPAPLPATIADVAAAKFAAMQSGDKPLAQRLDVHQLNLAAHPPATEAPAAVPSAHAAPAAVTPSFRAPEPLADGHGWGAPEAALQGIRESGAPGESLLRAWGDDAAVNVIHAQHAGAALMGHMTAEQVVSVRGWLAEAPNDVYAALMHSLASMGRAHSLAPGVPGALHFEPKGKSMNTPTADYAETLDDLTRQIHDAASRGESHKANRLDRERSALIARNKPGSTTSTRELAVRGGYV